jgi:hypothetical protein
MIKAIMKTLRIFICLAITAQMIGCGTIMYPERKGQKSGKIDGGVAVLDGIGLLLFLVPGIIAFAVDFNNGTIYLPGTHVSSLEMKDLKMVKFDANNGGALEIEKIIKEQTGRIVRLDQPNVRITRMKSKNDMLTQLAKALPETSNRQVALLEQ